jgi:hypothetical protein
MKNVEKWPANSSLNNSETKHEKARQMPGSGKYF